MASAQPVDAGSVERYRWAVPSRQDPATVVRYELERARAAGELVRIEREAIQAEAVTGFPLVVGADLLLLQRLDDFDLAGYALLRVADVTDVVTSEVERFTERVLRDEDQLRLIRPPRPEVPAGEWTEVFAALADTRRVVIVESEDFDDEEFYIGRIVGLTRDAVIFHHFDAVGVWDDEPTAIPFAEITRVRFDERYTTVFEPYIGEPPSAQPDPPSGQRPAR